MYDRTQLPGYYVAIGTSGNQFKNAPVVGRFMAEIIHACEGGQDHDSSPVQVKLARTGHMADMGHYSRLRTINPNSSFSVMGWRARPTPDHGLTGSHNTTVDSTSLYFPHPT